MGLGRREEYSVSILYLIYIGVLILVVVLAVLPAVLVVVVFLLYRHRSKVHPCQKKR